MNVIGYLRVSTDNQAKEDKFGLDVQREKIKEYCSHNDMTILDWVIDEGESGAKTRPGFDRIVYGEVANPPCEAVVVAKTDRVARDINVYYYYKMMLRKKNVSLISISEDFGQMGVFASMLEAFTLCVAEMERENINKRTSAGREMKASRGGYSGGKPPFGYKVENHRLVIVPEEAEVIRKVFYLKAEGVSLRGICDRLDADGIKTRKGTKFSFATIQGFLANEQLYRGFYKYGDSDWVKGEHEAILTDD